MTFQKPISPWAIIDHRLETLRDSAHEGPRRHWSLFFGVAAYRRLGTSQRGFVYRRQNVDSKP